MSLKLAEANRIVEGALAKAKELNILISAAVVDGGGRLLAFQRMDNATWASVFGCQGKAMASVGFGRTSGELQGRADTPIIRGIVAAEGGHMIPKSGGRPHHAERPGYWSLRRGRRHQPGG